MTDWLKKLPMWGKGGILGVLVSIILLVFALFYNLFVMIALFPYVILLEFFGFTFLGSGLDAFNLPNWLGWLLNFLVWFALGAILGLAIGKFKSYNGNFI